MAADGCGSDQCHRPVRSGVGAISIGNGVNQGIVGATRHGGSMRECASAYGWLAGAPSSPISAARFRLRLSSAAMPSASISTVVDLPATGAAQATPRTDWDVLSSRLELAAGSGAENLLRADIRERGRGATGFCPACPRIAGRCVSDVILPLMQRLTRSILAAAMGGRINAAMGTPQDAPRRADQSVPPPGVTEQPIPYAKLELASTRRLQPDAAPHDGPDGTHVSA